MGLVGLEGGRGFVLEVGALLPVQGYAATGLHVACDIGTNLMKNYSREGLKQE